MKFSMTRAAARWLFINACVVSLMFTCTFNAARVVESTTPDTLESLKNGLNSVSAQEIELPVERPRVAHKTYYDVSLDYDLQDHIFEVCEEYGVNPAVIFAMIWTESSFRVSNVGDGGDSLGLMQVQPKWHQKTANALGYPDLMNPYHNIVVGTHIFAGHLREGRGIEYALMAYNGGPSYAKRKMAAGEISEYAAKVLSRARLLESQKINVKVVVEG